jgi:hypothetical protein
MEFDHSTDTISPDDQAFVTFGGTGSIVFPVGTTAQRPGSPVLASIRWNTDTSSLEVYNSSNVWASQFPSGISQLGKYKSVTNNQAATDPGSGNLKWNNATLSSSTAIYIDSLTSGGFDATTYFNNLNFPSTLYIQDLDDASIFQRWTVASKVDNTGWFTFNVTFVDGSGTFGNNKNIAITILFNGNSVPAAGGSTTQVQFNSSGSLAGSANLTVNTGTGQLIAAAGLSLSGASSPITLNGSVGTAGQVLSSAGAGATPTWAAAGGSVSPLIWCGTAGGTANALTITPSPAIASYASAIGQQFVFKAASNSSATSPTMNISGQGAIIISMGITTVPIGGIIAGNLYFIVIETATILRISAYDSVSVNGDTMNGKLTILATDSLELGQSSTALGQITFRNASTVNYTRIQSGASSANWNLTLPLNNGGTNSFLHNAAGNGTTTWTNVDISTSDVTGTLQIGNGGTNITTYAVGDLLQGTASNVLGKLSSVATGNVLISGGVTTVSAWGKVDLTTHVSGNLPVTNLNSGTSASGTTFWCGNGTWTTPPASSSLPNATTLGVTANSAVTFTGITGTLSSAPMTISAGFSSSGTGNDITLTAGGTSGGDAGNTTIAGGTAGGANIGGSLTLRSGDTSSTGNAGVVTIHADSIYRGGGVTIRGGNSAGNSIAGANLSLLGGNSTNGSTSGSGGNVTITAGSSVTGGTSGGNVSINGGLTTSGSGGYVVLSTGATSLTERLRILANGAWSIGTGGAATGTSGQLLTSTGATTAPTWQSPAVSVTSNVATANQTTVSGATGAVTIGLASVLIAPGSLQITTSLQTSATNSITAAGTTQGTGTVLTTDYAVVTTTASGTGVVLPAGLAGRTVRVTNRGANALLVYPASGAQIDALGSNVAISVIVNGTLQINAISATQWYTVSNTSAGGSGTVTSVTVTQPGAGITVTNSGVAQTPAATSTIALANDLAAVEGLATTGIAVRTAADTWTTRTLGSGTNITVTNADGVAGAPSIALSGTVGVGNGGTGVTTTPTNGQLLVGNGTTYTVATLGVSTGISITAGAGTLTINNTGVTSNVATANQTTVSAATGAVTVGLSSTLVAPGSLQITTSLQSSATNSITAAGTTQGTGTVLTTDYAVVTTTASGTGVVLPAGLAGRTVRVTNRGANALLAYPASGAQIDALGANVAVTIIANGTLEVTAISATQWYIVSNTVVGGGGAVSSVTGTANQVTSTPTTGAVVVSLPSTLIAPGSVQATGNIIAGTATNSITTTTGTALNVIPGDAANATASGNALTITGGPGGSTSGSGGNIAINGGVPTNGTAGSISLTGANASGSFAGGVSLTAGSGSGTTTGGSISATAGSGGGGTQAGGTITISGGTGGTSGGAGGAVNIAGGAPNIDTGSPLPGTVTVKGGDSYIIGGPGGSVAITGTSASGAGNSAGGSVTLTAGARTGSGTPGVINLIIPTNGSLQLNSSAGTSGQALTSQGATTAPVWASVVTSIAGTANQITMSAATGAVTASFTLPTKATTAASAALNTTATYIAPTTFSIAANTLAVGDTFRITAYGTCTSTVANVTTFTPRLGAAGTTADTALTTLTATAATSGTTVPFVVTLFFVVRAIGASGSVYCYGNLMNNGATGITSAATGNVVNAGGATTINTTGALILGLSHVTAATTTTNTFQSVIVSRI